MARALLKKALEMFSKAESLARRVRKFELSRKSPRGVLEIRGDPPTRHGFCDRRLLQTIRCVQLVRRSSYAAARW